MEAKSGLSTLEAYDKYVRSDIEEIQYRIWHLLDEEMKVLIEKYPEGNFEELIELFKKRGIL
ncbi:MAG: hypothetical protein BAJALOKI1v1_2590005 [Promethearchaeota archaeon]|nr:MAG: hypothetical protein BAJALOKI1v1_2590005 [Candidatus Lokiarchaeota archaeon]